MRVVFMGTPAFAVPSLHIVAASHDVIAVYTRPDAISGRGRSLRPSPVKSAALELGVPIEQPRTLRDPDAVQTLRAYRPDVIIVAAYGIILPPAVLEVPDNGCINVHASVLPRHRGAAPIQRAILEGDESTGVSIMKMEEGLDTGPVERIVRVPVADQTADELTETLAQIGAQAVLETLVCVESGAARWVAQDETEATYAHKIGAVDVALTPDLSASQALRRIRASGGSAPARMLIDESPLVLHAARLADAGLAAGSVSTAPDGILVAFSDGALLVTEVTPAGRKRMDASAFARGARLQANADWRSIG